MVKPLNVFQKEVFVQDSFGIHARVAAKIAELTNKFNADVFLIKEGKEASAKSIIEILMLAVQKGEKITIKAYGIDAEKVIKEISNFLDNNFGVCK
jgi:phosphocarrier protein HPr